MRTLSNGEDLKGMVQLSLAMFFAGSSVIVGKALIDTIPVFVLSFCTLLVAFLTMLPMAVRRKNEIRAITTPQWLSMFMQALCGIILFRVFTLYGLRHTSAIQAGVIIGTTPAVLTILATIILGEKPSAGGIAGVLCAVGGMIALNISSSDGSGQGNFIGGLLIFAAVISEAMFTIFRKKVADDVSAITNTIVLIFISLIVFLPFAFWECISKPIVIQYSSVFGILYYGVFATVIAYLLWTDGVGKVSGEAAGAASAIMPASSVVLAAIILREPITMEHVLGCFMVMAGITFSTFFSKLSPNIAETVDH